MVVVNKMAPFFGILDHWLERRESEVLGVLAVMVSGASEQMYLLLLKSGEQVMRSETEMKTGGRVMWWMGGRCEAVAFP